MHPCALCIPGGKHAYARIHVRDDFNMYNKHTHNYYNVHRHSHSHKPHLHRIQTLQVALREASLSLLLGSSHHRLSVCYMYIHTEEVNTQHNDVREHASLVPRLSSMRSALGLVGSGIGLGDNGKTYIAII